VGVLGFGWLLFLAHKSSCSKMNTAVRTGLRSLAIALVVPLILSGACFLHGSFEQFPTDEQAGKVGSISGLGLISFALLEIIVVVVLLRKSKPKSSTVAAQQTVQWSETSP
jgi:uncharacterized membrane protein